MLDGDRLRRCVVKKIRRVGIVFHTLRFRQFQLFNSTATSPLAFPPHMPHNASMHNSSRTNPAGNTPSPLPGRLRTRALKLTRNLRTWFIRGKLNLWEREQRMLGRDLSSEENMIRICDLVMGKTTVTSGRFHYTSDLRFERDDDGGTVAVFHDVSVNGRQAKDFSMSINEHGQVTDFKRGKTSRRDIVLFKNVFLKKAHKEIRKIKMGTDSEN